jgi:hypothetical protein
MPSFQLLRLCLQEQSREVLQIRIVALLVINSFAEKMCSECVKKSDGKKAIITRKCETMQILAEKHEEFGNGCSMYVIVSV